MSLRMLRYGALAASLLAGALPAHADLGVKDGSGTLQTLCTTTFGTPSKHAYCHYLVDVNGVAFGTLANPFHTGLTFGGVDLTLGQKPKAGSIGVSLPLDPDILNAAATITAADAASTTATGQSGVSVVSGTPTAGSVYTYAVNGQSEADFTVTGAFVGTLQFEGSANGGVTWTPRSGHVMGTKFRTNQVTGAGIVHINAAGLTNVRIRAIALTSGTPSVQLNTTAGTGSVYVMNPIELSDNTTGLSASIKAGGTAAPTDPAITVYDAVIAALTGSPGDAAFTGSGNPTSLFGLFKGMFNQAAPTSLPGTSVGNATPVPGMQGVLGGVKVGVDTVVQATAVPRSTILPVQESAAAVSSGGTGNAVGDVLTFVGGSSTVPVSATQASPGKCTVTAVSSGAVSTCVPLAGSFGSYTSLPSNPVATTSSGSGTGATINVTYAGLAVQIAPANPNRRAMHLQPQGTLAYLRGAGIAATADYNALQVPTGALYETSPAFVGTGALSMITSGTTPLGVFGAEY